MSCSENIIKRRKHGIEKIIQNTLQTHDINCKIVGPESIHKQTNYSSFLLFENNKKSKRVTNYSDFRINL